MKEGIALKNGYSGIPDFAGDTHVCTLSIDTTKADIISVWKCPKCGHSIKPPKDLAQTTLEVTLKIVVSHPKGSLDANSVKATVSEAMEAITDNGPDVLSTVADESVESICVEVTQFKENGKRQALSLYGTDVVPWGRA